MASAPSKRETKSPAKTKTSAATHVALLRGINVGGKNLLPMKDLAEIFAQAGCAGIQTYIQSGNVVFSAPRSGGVRLAGEITRVVNQRFAISVPVIVRTAEEMEEVFANNPFLSASRSSAKGTANRGAADEDNLHVVFLAAQPSPAAVAGLDPARSPGDSFVVRGREIYLKLPNGVAKSKLTNAYFDSKLGTISTSRNWRTVGTLCRMARDS